MILGSKKDYVAGEILTFSSYLPFSVPEILGKAVDSNCSNPGAI